MKDDSGAEALDTIALARFLGSDTPVPAFLLAGGRSNLTFEVRVGETAMILRRPPLGHALKTAHDMGRESRVMAALADTVIPVPTVIASCDDPAVLGAPFYLMSKAEGQILRTDEDLADLGPSQARAFSYALIDTLADLHSVDPAAVGLADFGRPDGYLDRQVRRWKKQLAGSRVQDVPGFGRLADLLGDLVPASAGASIVHGDYRHDNVVTDAADPGRIVAVLDWEMATLGDPLADLGLFHLYWIGWAGIDNPIAAAPGVLPGFPSWDEIAGRYADRTGLSLDDLDFRIALAYFKLAVILEGIHARHCQGLTVGEGFDRIGAMVAPLVERGLTALAR